MPYYILLTAILYRHMSEVPYHEDIASCFYGSETICIRQMYGLYCGLCSSVQVMGGYVARAYAWACSLACKAKQVT